ncbi:hypothetical protein PTI98_010423 [Pleurotus ostreatus]|nr:hypothetical protein PTI98_010423 [Pleurotus ostreatus]
MSIIAPTQLDPRLFALARPGGPLFSQSQLLGFNSGDRYSHIPKAHASPAVTAFLVFKVKKQRSLRPKLRPRLNHHQRRMLAVAGVVANGHSASLHNGLEVDSTSVYSKLKTPPSHRGGTSVQAVFRVQVNRGTDEDTDQTRGVLADSPLSEGRGIGTASMEPLRRGDNAERWPPTSVSGYRNLKTLPLRRGETSDQTVFRPQLNRADEDTHVQSEQAQGFWANPLISEGYGMGTALLERVLEDGTSQVRQTPERLEALPGVEYAASEALLNPEPLPGHLSSDRSPQGPSLGTPSGWGASISSFLSEKDPSERGTTKLNEEIEELSNKYDALSEKVDIVVEGNQEVLEEVQSLRETISTMISNAGQSTTASKLASPDMKKPGMTKRRAVETLVLAKSVRGYLAILLRMGEEGRSEALTTVGSDDIQRFAELCGGNDVDGGDCCTVEDFRIDLIGPPRSLWNTSAANVFVHAFEAFTGVELDRQMVRTAFFTRLKTLKQEYKLSKKSKREQQNSIIQKRRKMRKRTLFIQRHDTVLHDHRLHKHISLLDRLGVDGMSSDESDGEECMGSEVHTAAPRFRVRRPVWRAQVVGRWLQAFDSFYLRQRQASQDKRGCYPRVRVRDNTEPSTSKDFVAGLPLNAYDQVWMVRQSDVCASQEHGDFSPIEFTE